MRFTQAKRGAHLHVFAPFPYLGNDRSHCPELWYVGKGAHQLCPLHNLRMGYLNLHVRTCALLLHISVRAGRLKLAFGYVIEQLAMHLYKVRVGFIHTFSRAYLFSMPGDPLDPSG